VYDNDCFSLVGSFDIKFCFIQGDITLVWWLCTQVKKDSDKKVVGLITTLSI